MKCNKREGLDIVCYKYEKCKKACLCPNVLKGIREKLKKQENEEQTKKK